MAPKKALEIEVVAHITGSMEHCSHCQVFIDGVGVGEQVHQENMGSYPPEFVEEWKQLSGWIQDLAEAHPGELVIRITDANSPVGIWKRIRNGVRRYPTFIIGGKEKYHGWDRDRLETMIEKRLQSVEA